MSDYFNFISVVLLFIALHGLWTGKTWYGGRTYFRETAKVNYYLGILTYFTLAVFTYLFGREL